MKDIMPGDKTVSVVMLVYNHSAYIEEALAGVFRQRVNFECELIIANDCSPDDSDIKISQFLEHQHHDMLTVNYLKRDENMGMGPNFLDALRRCQGKYIALCEGDDSWIDDQKLTKQVNFLEQNQRAVLCYSNAQVIDERNAEREVFFSMGKKPSQWMTSNQIIHHSRIPTCTVMYRNVIKLPDWFREARASAYFLFYLLSSKGDAYYDDQLFSLYNHHYQGMSRKTVISDMLKGDALLQYNLLAYFNHDPKIHSVIVNKHLVAVNHLFHRRAFNYAIQLFWQLPFIYLLKRGSYFVQLAKLAIKVHFLFFLSKNEQRTNY